MFSIQFLATLSSAVLLVSAAPARAPTPAVVTMDLPTNQTQLVQPTTAPLYVALGVGYQNYSCTASTGKYASIGAVAALFDLGCEDASPQFATVQTTAFDKWSASAASVADTAIGPQVGAPTLLGYHYFITGSTGALQPKWDFTSTGKNKGNATAFVLGSKVGDIAAPTDTAVNVDWLALVNAGGSLAQKMFRIDTVGGQPPTSCEAGSANITVKYTAKYFLY
ncbi:hypothetical protein FB45DRAFT_1002487 [Roridomyces roridus]|uniref:Malate dehydrogenase n=1 Tax=Roridomyces roridus TaxID=1738132 RepID=A0AAD7BZY9_9AGAR|nr:hypothetical protein FB45DRAFT_1002487 [Roridomyces roridus]